MVRVRKLSWRHVDIQVPTGKGVAVRVVECPGRWMTPTALAKLVADLNAVVSMAVPAGPLTYGVVAGKRERLDAAILALAYEPQTGRPVAFTAMSLLPVELDGRQVEVLHLGLTVIHPALRQRGLSRLLYTLPLMLRFIRNRFRPLWISNVSQVPSAVAQVGENFAKVYPGAETDSERDTDHLMIARQIVEQHRSAFGVGPNARFDSERFVIVNAYTGGSDNLKKPFEDVPKHRRDTYNEMCRVELDYVRGDDFLQVGQYTLGVLWRCLRDDVRTALRLQPRRIRRARRKVSTD